MRTLSKSWDDLTVSFLGQEDRPVLIARRSPPGRRPNPVFSEEYRAVREVVREARCAARLSQRQLAAKLDKAASHVALIERGQRRIDALELYRMAKAFGLPPAELFGLIAARLDTLQERIDRA